VRDHGPDPCSGCTRARTRTQRALFRRAEPSARTPTTQPRAPITRNQPTPPKRGEPITDPDDAPVTASQAPSIEPDDPATLTLHTSRAPARRPPNCPSQAASQGIEPWFLGSEPSVLPLDEVAVREVRLPRSVRPPTNRGPHYVNRQNGQVQQPDPVKIPLLGDRGLPLGRRPNRAESSPLARVRVYKKYSIGTLYRSLS
jgi:hypothetical protein